MRKVSRFPLLYCVVLLALIAMPAVLEAQEIAKPSSADVSGFAVIGISARTNNIAETGPNGEIPKLWQRLFMEGLLNRIPGRSDESIVAVYTKYASDAGGDYTCVLGAKVAAGTKPPDGMVAVTIPAGNYREFVSAKGPGQEVLPVVWTQIYGYFRAPNTPKRAFQSDFERYDGPFDPNAMQAHIYIGVKP
jgi:predicted transcriptional regulator YdeE